MDLGWMVFLLFAGCSVALENTQALNVSQRCMEDTNTFLWEINQDKPKEYAVLMYDAFGKMGSNVEGGNANQPGLMSECRSAHGPAFSGQYCQVFLSQGTVQYFVGICVPDSCGEDDVQMLVLYERLQFGQMSLIPPLPPILVNQSTQEMIMTNCLLNIIALDASAIICLFACSLMVAIPLVATLITAIIRWKRSKEVSPTTESSCLNSDSNLSGTLKTNGVSSSNKNSSTSEDNSHNSTRDTPTCSPRSCVYQFLQAFSLQTTSKGLFNTSIPGGGYAYLNGIRILSLLWVISGHSALTFKTILDNPKDLRKALESSAFYVLSLSGPIFLAVDTFLLLGGLLSARSLLSSIHRAEDKMSPSLVGNYLFRRIKRVQPLHMFIMCLYIAMMQLLQGRVFEFTNIAAEKACKTNWWANVLLINNLLPNDDTCIPWTWYLSLDFQSYATTPLLVYLYRLNKRVFAVVAGGLLLLTTAAGAIITAFMKLPVFQPTAHNVEIYQVHYYEKPYTRYGPFLIGILTGIYMKTKKDQLVKKKWQAALGWFCCLLVLAVVIAVAYVLKETPDYPSAGHALYQALHRPLWTLAVTWVILACEEGYGGFIKSLLSLGFWGPLSNISFACYLTHPVFLTLYGGLQETPIHYTDISFMYLFFGNLLLSLGVSCVLTVLVEKPYGLLKWSST